MGLFDQFPYTNFHELNLDWILGQMKNVEEYVKNIEGVIGETTRKMIESLYEKGLLTTPYNVISNGADNTGGKDASTIIQTVLDTFKICFIPNGTYRLEKPIVVDSGMLILGESATDTILKCVNNDGFVTRDFDDRTGKGNAEAPHGFSLFNLHLTGNDMHTGVKIYGYHYFIQQCFIEHFETGIYSEYNKNTGFAPSGDTFESYIEKSLIQHCTKCINFLGPSDSFINHVCFSNAKIGIILTTSATSWSNGCSVNNCHGYTIFDGGAGCCYDINAPVFLNDSTGESSDIGCLFETNTGARINGGHFYNNKYGIVVDTTSNVIINGAECRGNKTAEVQNKQELADSYIDIITHGANVKTLDERGAINPRTCSLKIYNELDANIINRPKCLQKQHVDPSTLTPGKAIKISDRYPAIVYQTGGTGIYVNDNVTSDPIGDVNTFFVPAGGHWSFATAPGTITYQPILI